MSKVTEFIESMKFIEQNAEDVYVDYILELARAIEEDLKQLVEREKLKGQKNELVEMCLKYSQLPIPEKAMLDRIAELEAQLEGKE